MSILIGTPDRVTFFSSPKGEIRCSLIRVSIKTQSEI